MCTLLYFVLNLTAKKVSLVIVYVHLVWVTKKRIPFLYSKILRVKTWRHILEYAKSKDIKIDHINGYKEHCHCLVQLKSNQNLQSIVHLLKGESSYWINEQNLFPKPFQWQAGFYAASVSQKSLNFVRRYIRNQEIHHQSGFLKDELENLFPKAGV
ncbi:MAG: IS200/IS605 family transposase [Saprospiraceae bacterium]|jgi:REP element-mobilizing transposase RayT